MSEQWGPQASGRTGAPPPSNWAPQQAGPRPPSPAPGRGTPAPPRPPRAPRTPRRGLRRPLLIALAATVGLALVAAGGVFAYRTVLAAHRPAEALPRTCFAYGEINLAPRTDQLVALASFVGNLRPPQGTTPQQQRKPSLNSSSPKQAIFEALVASASSGVTWAEAEPWLGDRVGACLDGRTALFAVQTAKPAEAAAALQRISAREVNYPLRDLQVEQLDGYVLASPDRVGLRRAAAQVRAGDTLAKRATFAQQVGGLDAGVLGSFWADAAGYLLQDSSEPVTFLRGVRAAGTLTFDPAFAALDVTVGNLPTDRALEGSVRDLVGTLPADTTLAAGSSSPSALADVVSAFAAGTSAASGFREFFADYGIGFPTDAEAYAGNAAAIGTSGSSSEVYGLVKTADPDGTGRRLSDAGAAYRQRRCASCVVPLVVVGTDRVALADTGDVATRLVQGGGGLGAFELFSKAVDPRDGAVVAFTSEPRSEWGSYAGAYVLPWLGIGELRAIGLSGSTRADGTGHLTVRYVA